MDRRFGRASARAWLHVGVSRFAMAVALASFAGRPALAADEPAQSPQAPGEDVTQDIIVTGSTSKRSLISESVNVTLVDERQLLQRAPRATADILDQVPGIFVESTAGQVSNNYSVRGLPGGGQNFITFEEDGLPVIYQGGGADEYFINDITIDRVEAVEGGTSGILAVNGAGATINFINRKLSFDKPTALVRFTGTTYNEFRGDFYLSAPVPETDNLAFSIGGFVKSSPGVRDNPFTYEGYQVKAALEKRFDRGGFVRLSVKAYDDHEAYYADQPYSYNGIANINGVPGLNPQFGNIVGRGFGSIKLPTSPFTGENVREFSQENGIHLTGQQARVDFDVPLDDHFEVFGKVRYLDATFDFNGIFPGSGSGNGGLQSAESYLNATTSPIASTLMQGLAAFPGTTQFALRNLTTGAIIPASAVGTLNALNGNGLLQQTVLNKQTFTNREIGSDFGVRHNFETDTFTNSLTVGAMIYDVHQTNDQSAVSTLINDVTSNSNIYDVLALNSQGAVLGTLTNNGILNYGDWGNGIYHNHVSSQSYYANNEFTLEHDLHIDLGIRYEHEQNIVFNGNSFATNLPVPPGTPGLARDIGGSFDGTFTKASRNLNPISYTAGINYQILPELAAYVRYAYGNQTPAGNNTSAQTRITLYEGGLRYAGHGLAASIIGFRTEFNNQNYNFIDPSNPAVNGSFFADSVTNGFDLSGEYRPEWEPLHAFDVSFELTYQEPVLSNVKIDGVASGLYNGNTPQRTPQMLAQITPSYTLPDDRGEVFVRYKYVGDVFADSGNGLALPAYSVVSIGALVNITPNLYLNANVENVFNTLGLTEGNPRQGNTQAVVNGYFYGRGIIGTNALFSLTYKY